MISIQRFCTAATCAALLVFAISSSGCFAQSFGKKQQGSGAKQAGSGSKAGSDNKAEAGSGSKEMQGSTSKAAAHPALTNPSLANKTAPEKFFAKFSTTKGDFVIEVTRAWSPNGADRFYNMVDIGYFNQIAIFRAVPNFMFQFGVHGDPNVSKHWSKATIKDDPPANASNVPGYVTFAKTGAPNSRSAQMFVNLGNNNFLDSQGFTPFGKIVEGLDVVAKINTEYGENDREDQGSLTAKGNAWLMKKYPRLDVIKSVELVEAK